MSGNLDVLRSQKSLFLENIPLKGNFGVLGAVTRLSTIGELLCLEGQQIVLTMLDKENVPRDITFDYSTNTEGFIPSRFLDKFIDWYRPDEQELIQEYIYNSQERPKAWKHGDYDGRMD